jgi:hypothetical protein
VSLRLPLSGNGRVSEPHGCSGIKSPGQEGLGESGASVLAGDSILAPPKDGHPLHPHHAGARAPIALLGIPGRLEALDNEKLFNSDREALPKPRDNSPTPGADATANSGLS